MHKLCDYLTDELKELEEKVARGGKLSRTEIEDGKNIAKFKTALLTNEAMENEGYSGTEPHYRSERRDMRGRYSRDRYSRDDSRDSMIHDLREIMQDAPDEHTKKRFHSFIRELENA